MRPLAAVVAFCLLSSCASRKEVAPDLRHPTPMAVGLGNPKQELEALMMRVYKGDLPKIEFDVDSDQLRLSSTPTLDTVADLLMRYPEVRAYVVAHSDDTGSEEHNLDLSRGRAKSVMAYLASRGVPPTALRFRGVGASQPLADNSTEEGREKNRRVEFRLSTRGWQAGW